MCLWWTLIRRAALPAAMLLGLPLLGAGLAGLPLEQLLEFPPTTRYVAHPPFSKEVFAAYLLLIVAILLPLVRHGAVQYPTREKRSQLSAGFPWWGWAGVLGNAAAWTLAWTRFTWFAPLQPHTFTPLWLSFIVVVNGLTYRKTGRCLMTHETKRFLAFFPASALFWWFFEYLNRFVQNWTYVNLPFGGIEYFLFATCAFSTVIPAVISVKEWLESSFPVLDAFSHYRVCRPSRPKLWAAAVLTVSSFGLLGIGVFPGLLFSLLWVSPLAILVSIQAIEGEEHIFSGIARGNWRDLAAAALAGLICGWFWEMWNTYSLAKWVYSIPYVHAFKVFEMPILGYAGYFPFGLECLAVARLLQRRGEAALR